MVTGEQIVSEKEKSIIDECFKEANVEERLKAEMTIEEFKDLFYDILAGAAAKCLVKDLFKLTGLEHMKEIREKLSLNGEMKDRWIKGDWDIKEERKSK